MKRRLLTSVAALLASASMAVAQLPTATSTPEPPVAQSPERIGGPKAKPLAANTGDTPTTPIIDTSRSAPNYFAPSYVPTNGPRLWGSADYMLWWVKSAPISVPLTTVGDPTTAAATGLPVAALGTPGTVVISPNQQNFGPLSGYRLAVGGWVNCEQTIGAEIGGFMTETRNSQYTATLGPTSGVVLGVPFVATPPTVATPTQAALVLSLPALPAPFPGFPPFPGATGTSQITSDIRLFGFEANGLVRVVNDCKWRVDLLGGFRYIDLMEDLQIVNTSDAPFLQTVFGDRFGTRNSIYAGQLGARAETHFNRFFVNVTGKLALGDNQEKQMIVGSTVLTPAPGVVLVGPTSAAGGIFTQRSNIGTFQRDAFIVVPEVQLKVGVDLTPHVRLYAGYEFLYLSNVIRPGDQLDRVVNVSQVFGAPLVGVPRPQAGFASTDFWAQGVNFGLTVRY